MRVIINHVFTPHPLSRRERGFLEIPFKSLNLLGTSKNRFSC